MSKLITKLFRKKRILLPYVHLSQIVLSAVISVFLIQYNTIQYNTIQHRLFPTENTITPQQQFLTNIGMGGKGVDRRIILASFIYGAITVWPMRGFSTNISLLFASPHSNTRQYYDIECRRHGICDHGSMSTLITKLFRKNRILIICPLVSDCTNGSNFCFPYTIWLKSRRKMQPLPVYVSANPFENKPIL